MYQVPCTKKCQSLQNSAISVGHSTLKKSILSAGRQASSRYQVSSIKTSQEQGTLPAEGWQVHLLVNFFAPAFRRQVSAPLREKRRDLVAKGYLPLIEFFFINLSQRSKAAKGS
jgi:hypothetical protein